MQLGYQARDRVIFAVYDDRDRAKNRGWRVELPGIAAEMAARLTASESFSLATKPARERTTVEDPSGGVVARALLFRRAS
jgi:hypothetical protein